MFWKLHNPQVRLIGDDVHSTLKNKKRGLKNQYLKVEGDIKSRLVEFKQLWKGGTEEDIFAELVFCLLTPQSKAKSCNDTVCGLIEMDLLINGNEREIAEALRRKTRFHNTKAKNIILARKTFTKKGKLALKNIIADFDESKEARDWLVDNVRGMGLKEASHFLRNIGMGEDLAILDRHILKNLVYLGVIGEVPSSLTNKKYLEIENKMKKFAKENKIPLAHLDLLLWYKETGKIFK
jgi:N-glycosylase/DNA lyase